jgi:hypothetical protein
MPRQDACCRQFCHALKALRSGKRLKLRTARLLCRQQHIGDFTRWKDHDAYSKGLERLLRDLKVEPSVPPA